MKKDNSVKLGTTKCDFCSEPASTTSGIIITCDKCAKLVKSASVDQTLRSVGVTLRNSHK